ncbi:MAG: GFA family protein [Alphaproteobacteria bacterium]|nr:GFA family protein [Alphaproteobacteria bacterium]
MTITGGCACGKVRYTIEGEPVVTRVCWCRACQFTGGGNTPVNAVFKTEDVKIEGALADFVSEADSGNQVHRRFCPTCGTPVTVQSEARPQYLGVRAGTMDDPSAVKPDMTIWISAAPPWAIFDDTIPCYEHGLPPPGKK